MTDEDFGHFHLIFGRRRESSNNPTAEVVEIVRIESCGIGRVSLIEGRGRCYRVVVLESRQRPVDRGFKRSNREYQKQRQDERHWTQCMMNSFYERNVY